MDEHEQRRRKADQHIEWLEKTSREFNAWAQGREDYPRSAQLREAYASMLAQVKAHLRPDRELLIRTAAAIAGGMSAAKETYLANAVSWARDLIETADRTESSGEEVT